MIMGRNTVKGDLVCQNLVKKKGHLTSMNMPPNPQIIFFYKITSLKSLAIAHSACHPKVQVLLLLHHWAALSLCLFNESLVIKFCSPWFLCSPLLLNHHLLHPPVHSWQATPFLFLSPQESLPHQGLLTKGSGTPKEITSRLIGNRTFCLLRQGLNTSTDA